MKKLVLLSVAFIMLAGAMQTQAQYMATSAEYILSWDVCPTANTPGYRAEYYSVWISTTGNDPADFTTMLFDETISTQHTNWAYENRQVSMDDYANLTVYVAFRHHNITDMDRIVIDNVKLFRISSDGDEELVYLFEDFQGGIGSPLGEDWLPDGWLAIDSDGDGLNWYFGERQGEGAMRSQSWDGDPLTPDNWLITPAVLLGTVSIDELSAVTVSVFPNPATSLITLLGTSDMKRVELVNLLGSVVLAKEVNASKTSVDVSPFSQGVYLLRIFTDQGMLTKKLHILN